MRLVICANSISDKKQKKIQIGHSHAEAEEDEDLDKVSHGHYGLSSELSFMKICVKLCLDIGPSKLLL